MLCVSVADFTCDFSSERMTADQVPLARSGSPVKNCNTLQLIGDPGKHQKKNSLFFLPVGNIGERSNGSKRKISTGD